MNESKNLWFFTGKKKKGDPYFLSTMRRPKYIRRMTSGTGDDLSVVGEYVITCPFHEEKTPSCLVFRRYDGPDAGKASFHCLGCGRSGDCTFEKLDSSSVGDRDFELEQETFDEIRLFGSEHLLEILMEIKSVLAQIEDGVDESTQRLLLAYFNAIIRYAIMLDDKLKGKY